MRRRRDHIEQVGRGLVVVFQDAVALALRAGDGPQMDDLTLGPSDVAPTMWCVHLLHFDFLFVVRHDKLEYLTQLW